MLILLLFGVELHTTTFPYMLSSDLLELSLSLFTTKVNMADSSITSKSLEQLERERSLVVCARSTTLSLRCCLVSTATARSVS